MTSPFHIVAAIDPIERPVMIAAAEQFVRAISAAVGGEHTVQLSFVARDAPPPKDARMAIISLRGEVGASRSIEAVTAHWNDWLETFGAAGGAQIVIATIYRHVANGDSGIVERIRRLNALAVGLSRDHAIEVADIDRACALVGSRMVGGDWRAVEGNAAAIAGHVLAAALLRLDLSAHLVDDAGDGARAAHGSLNMLIERLKGNDLSAAGPHDDRGQ